MSQHLVVTVDGYTYVVECSEEAVKRAAIAECVEEGYDHRDELDTDKDLPRVNYWDWNPA